MFNFESKVLIVGLVRNAISTLQADLEILSSSFAGFTDLQYLFIESDSSDGTVAMLEQLSFEYANLNFISLGALDKSMPVREERISFCRNRYLQELAMNPKFANTDYVAVADMDGINTYLNENSIRSCFARSDWDACFANQVGYYYDIYALRHRDWSPDNCWEFEAELRDSGVPHIIAREKAVYSRQKKINPQAGWIEVDSAFGGFGIYDIRFLRNNKYSPVDDKNHLICEHVALHENMRKMGARLFINPALLNSQNNAHVANRRWFNRFKWLLKLVLVKISKDFASKPI